MSNPIDQYWKVKLGELKNTLEENKFEVFLAENAADAKRVVLEKIISELKPRSVSWGGSMTFTATSLYEELKENPDLVVIDTFDRKVSREKALERRRQALVVDLFITGSNAITQDGRLVNLDMIGNRVAAITFGPNNVIILAGRNKIVPDLEAAMLRIKDYAAPANVMRLSLKNPCAKTGICMDCRSPDRICNHWTITEKSFPEKRIKIVLINEDLGL
ncbi:MAG: lactate utilization protein [Desulfobacterales bacterium]|nr:lactate utilization protein [Desulfobacterales bacterium]